MPSATALSLRSTLQPTRMTGIWRPHIERTSSIHCGSAHAQGHAHLLCHVVQGVRCVDGESDQDDMGFGVRQRPQSFIFFLAGRIPQCELSSAVRPHAMT